MVTMADAPQEARAIASRYFGPVPVDGSAEIQFPGGIPGFESENSFVALEIPEQRPLLYLQSRSNADLCFLTLPFSVVSQESAPQPSDDEREALHMSLADPDNSGNLLTLVILFSANGLLRANISAPLIVNLQRMIGLQRIPAEGASLRYLELRESGEWVESC